MSTKTKKKYTGPKYWYHIKVRECIFCGREEKWRKRVYKKEEAGIEYQQDACPQHFM